MYLYAAVLVLALLPSLLAARLSVSGACAGQRSRPVLVGATASETSYTTLLGTSLSYLYATYGEDVTVFCSAGDTVDLIIQSKGRKIQTEELNATTILFIDKPDIGRYVYHCKNDESNCGSTLEVKVFPTISLTSQNLYTLKAKREVYFVPRGDFYSVICVGKGSSLNIFDVSHTVKLSLQTDSVNMTAVKYTTKANFTGSKEYICIGVFMSRRIIVMVDYYPDVQSFECILHVHRWHKLVCTWFSSSERNTFKLFRKHEKFYRGNDLLCVNNLEGFSRECTSEIKEDYTEFIPLILQICNKVFCVNQTFTFNKWSIEKLESPSGVKVLNTSSHGAAVVWRNPRGVWVDSVMYKVEYRLLATAWRMPNSISVQCGHNDLYGCECQLSLPCSDAHYELRVYAKRKETLEDRFWSEPSDSLFFYTDETTGADAETNPDCSLKFTEQPPLTKDNILYEVRKLINYEHEHDSVLKKDISVLRQKLGEVKAIVDFLN